MILNDLNSPQREAVTTTEGPLLILAGAGSGKTRVLTHRIAHIVEKDLASAEQILAVTFTNKAAGEMKKRVQKLLQSQLDEPYSAYRSYNFLPFIGTFHSVCVKILRKDGSAIGIDPYFTIYDTDDQKTAVKQALKELGLSVKEFNPKTVQTYISSAKNELISPEQYKAYTQGYLQEKVGEIYPLYQKILASNNALDFDDLINRTIELLSNNSKILLKYQNLFKYVLVDEYQDTNHAQYIFINLLARKRRNVCVVGDDDQAIYSWRGATIKNILSFEKDYPETTIIKLEQNYRSTGKILSAAYEVIKHNKSRKHKKLWTDMDDGNSINVHKCYDEKDESKFVAESIESLMDQNVSPNDIAVLYRVNALSRNLEEAMLAYGIPYQIYGSISFYQRKEIKDTLAYLRILHNPKDDVSLRRIINTPSRKIGTITLESITNKAKANKQKILEYLLSAESIDYSPLNTFVNKVKNFLKILPETKLTDLIETVLKDSGYLSWLDDGTIENQTRIENIKELITVASKYEDLDSQTALSEFLQEVSLIEEQQVKSQNMKDKDRVTLLTLHSAKGLEFDNIFIVGLEEGLFPHSRSYTDPAEMEEERRLAYVGITRTKSNLTLTHTESRRFFGTKQENLVSRFIDDIPKEILNYSSWNDSEFEEEDDDSRESLKVDLIKGDRVEHKDFGKGIVLDISDNIIKVDFGPLVGVKQLAFEYANLRKTEELSYDDENF